MTLSHYMDLVPVPEEEMGLAQLMGDIFSMIHKALAFSKEKQVGISLPRHQKGDGQRPPSLGQILRLHGTEESLKALLARPELKTLGDYVFVHKITPVPRETKYRVVRRVQVKSNPARLLRRSVRKGWLSEAEAAQRLESTEAKRVALPYFQAKSSSTKQDYYRLLIDHGTLQEKPAAGHFSSYGLSQDGATVPWF